MFFPPACRYCQQVSHQNIEKLISTIPIKMDIDKKSVNYNWEDKVTIAQLCH